MTTAKKPMQVGDRVACYWAWSADRIERVTGVITGISPVGVATVQGDSGTPDFHSLKQCRRLVKKPKRVAREWWLVMHDCSEPRVRRDYEPALFCGSGCKIEWVKVREVLPKKERKP